MLITDQDLLVQECMLQSITDRRHLCHHLVKGHQVLQNLTEMKPLELQSQSAIVSGKTNLILQSRNMLRKSVQDLMNTLAASFRQCKMVFHLLHDQWATTLLVALRSIVV